MADLAADLVAAESVPCPPILLDKTNRPGQTGRLSGLGSFSDWRMRWMPCLKD